MMNASTDHHAGFTGARESRLSVARFALTGALVALLVFALCWVATFLPDVRVTHMYIQLFTAARMSSGAALVEGLCWSLVAGGAIGGLIALVHNGVDRLFRR